MPGSTPMQQVCRWIASPPIIGTLGCDPLCADRADGIGQASLIEPGDSAAHTVACRGFEQLDLDGCHGLPGVSVEDQQVVVAQVVVGDLVVRALFLGESGQSADACGPGELATALASVLPIPPNAEVVSIAGRG